MPRSPDYNALAELSIELYRIYAAGHPSTRSSAAAAEPSSAAGLSPLDFDTPTPKAADRYLHGNFVKGTWVYKLESEVQGEEGLYNVALDPTMRTPYALLLPTKDYHEQSAPLRPAYLTHAHRLLVALEDGLARKGEVKGKKVVAVYDCGEKSGVRIGHKCVRFFVVEGSSSPTIPHRSHVLPRIDTSSESPDPRVDTFTALLNGTSEAAEPFIQKTPHYNLIMSREEMFIVPRVDDGFLGKAEGRWDGARLMGVPL